MPKKICPACGIKLTGAPKFCPECGERFVNTPLPSSSAEEDYTEDYEETYVEEDYTEDYEETYADEKDPDELVDEEYDSRRRYNHEMDGEDEAYGDEEFYDDEELYDDEEYDSKRYNDAYDDEEYGEEEYVEEPAPVSKSRMPLPNSAIKARTVVSSKMPLGKPNASAHNADKSFHRENIYDPNHDHYYDDVLPELLDEINHFPVETILKIAFGFLLLVAVILYCVYYVHF